jgi:hypothetical protein
MLERSPWAWWDKNKIRFPDEIQKLEIPDFTAKAQ